MRPTTHGLALILAAGALSLAGGHAVASAPPGPNAPPGDRGTPGHWTKISTGTVGITYAASLYRTGDGVLHVVYPKDVGGGAQLGHTAVGANGTTISQTDMLPAPWSERDSSPIVIGDGAGGLRAVFGGTQTLSPGYWSDGRMYTVTAPEAGTPWALPAQAVGASHTAYGSYGTAATTLADGTPIAAFPLNSDIVWHVGTGEADADQSFTVDGCCAYDLALVRDGDAVWLSWYANGGSASTNGTFVRQIYPSLGTTMKAPMSGAGASSVPTGRTALVARAGGGVYAAYCQGYPNCTNIRLWKVGSATSKKVPASRYADNIALSAGPAGRIWLAWSDNLPVVKAMRTGRTGLGMGAVRTVGSPPATSSIYTVAIDGTDGRGDVVVNIGAAFWHSQVLPGLSLKAAPKTWRHGNRQRVTFTVSDGGDPVSGAVVRVGSRHCRTAASGSCRIRFPASVHRGRLHAKASYATYAPAKATLRVR